MPTGSADSWPTASSPFAEAGPVAPGLALRSCHPAVGSRQATVNAVGDLLLVERVGQRQPLVFKKPLPR